MFSFAMIGKDDTISSALMTYATYVPSLMIGLPGLVPP